jgi:UDP-N-acetyl-2-amino-2-deoxyglucuronate dehydrogenase
MLKFALIGCGRIAQRHAQLLAEGHVAGASLAAVCDVLPERAAAFGGVPSAHA